MTEKELRRLVFATYGARCMCCGERDGRMELNRVDSSPELAMVFDNIQPLCVACDVGMKATGGYRDWRAPMTIN